MTKPPAGSLRDTAKLAAGYSETSQWQHERGVLLLEVAKPAKGQRILDIGCGTGDLSAELASRVAPSGQVIAIDPDRARLEFARSHLPPGLHNLTFEQASGEDIHNIGDRAIDLIYSNYALHWMINITTVFSEVRRVLRPGGRLATEFLGQPIRLFEHLLVMMPAGETILSENIFLQEPEWREIIQASGLEIIEISWPQFALNYKDLQSLFRWLEATSQGAFDHKRIGPDERAILLREFPGAISCSCRGLRMVLRRPE